MKKPYNIAITLLLMLLTLYYGIVYWRAFMLLPYFLRDGWESLKLTLEVSPAFIYAPGATMLGLVIFVGRFRTPEGREECLKLLRTRTEDRIQIESK